MRSYADSSFLLRLVTADPDSECAIAEYRRIGKPPLFFLPLHALEVRNAILQRAFHQRRAIAAGERQHVARERDAAFGRLERLLSRHTLLDVTLDMDITIAITKCLSSADVYEMNKFISANQVTLSNSVYRVIGSLERIAEDTRLALAKKRARVERAA